MPSKDYTALKIAEHLLQIKAIKLLRDDFAETPKLFIPDRRFFIPLLRLERQCKGFATR